MYNLTVIKWKKQRIFKIRKISRKKEWMNEWMNNYKWNENIKLNKKYLFVFDKGKKNSCGAFVLFYFNL